jgi:group I intron endonuclease
MGVLYIIRNRVNSKVYVGITTHSLKHRWQGHCTASRTNKPGKLYNAIRKHGMAQFYIEAVAEDLEWPDLCQAEIALIQKLDSQKLGYNASSGGTGNKGYVASEETRVKLCEARRKRVTTPETRQKMSAAMKGRKPTAFTIQQAIAARTGSKVSEETREKQRQAKIGSKRPPEVCQKISAALRLQHANGTRNVDHLKGKRNADKPH